MSGPPPSPPRQSVTGTVVDEVGYDASSPPSIRRQPSPTPTSISRGTPSSVVQLQIADPATDNALQFALLPRPSGLASYLTLHLGSDSFPLADATVSPEIRQRSFEYALLRMDRPRPLLVCHRQRLRQAHLLPRPPLVPCADTPGCFQILTSSDLVPLRHFRRLLLPPAVRLLPLSDAATPPPPTSPTTTRTCRPLPPVGHADIHPLLPALQGHRQHRRGRRPRQQRQPPTSLPTRACPSTGSAAARWPTTTRTSTTGPGTTRPTRRTSPEARRRCSTVR